MEVETQAPVTSPEPENPNEQLEFELSKHASIALQARAMREKEEDREILELLTLLDKKVSSMEQRNLTRAASFSNALQSFVHNYFTQPNMVARDQTSTAKPAPARPPKTYAAATTASKPDSKTMRKPHTRSSKPERPLRLFLRLPTDQP
ncbi:hypothetical protein SI65_06455 [Aspergillus cristatus]|uniref:Uncharacterized protein n=1 Tax=Aspergillus cristatus TaxID=573508 RepID=A0A1E3B9P5_ASPCR|nr:hypothetical protein SI65_06455 [Aspergillus cristatus]